jgi:predicted ABC-class ATPase
MAKTFEKKAVLLDEHNSKTQRELRQQIMEQSKTLRDEFLEKSRELSESFGRAVQELRIDKTENHSLDISISWQGVKWRLEAMRTGKPFGEVVLLHTLRYRVEQVFPIQRESGLLLLHVAAKAVTP